jgi:uncharacterized membrane protein
MSANAWRSLIVCLVLVGLLFWLPVVACGVLR